MNPVFMALLLVGGWGLFAYSARSRWKLMMTGAAAGRFDRPRQRLAATLKYAIAQLRMRRYPLAGTAHLLIFVGFFVLLPRTLVLWGRGFNSDFDLWILGTGTTLGNLYSLFKDVFVVLVILGTIVFLYYRAVARLPRMTLNFEGLLILLIILTMMTADVLYDGASLALAARTGEAAQDGGAIEGGAATADLTFHVWEPAGSLVQFALAGVSDATLSILQHIGFWTHGVLVLLFLNLLPYSKHFHVITAIPNVYLQNLYPPGKLPTVRDIEGKLEREETLGIRRIGQFSWKSILDFYTCTECGRCSDHCPATNTGKKLSPKHFTIDLRDFLYDHKSDLVRGQAAASNGDDAASSETPEYAKDLVNGVIDPEVLWACTTCRACEQECPVFITYVDKIVDMRRYLVMERGEFPNQLQSAFRGLESNANPWSFPAEDRAKWTDGLNVKTIEENPDAPVLFWVGCAPSFEERSKSVTRAMATLLQRAGVDFAILGTQEQCTGDPARRAGNEYLFQMLAQANVEVLNACGAARKTIVTTCPHCFNTLRNEYPDFGGHYDVVHHTTFLSRLIREGRLKPRRPVEKRVVFHDSCYLGRYNDVYDAPREALRAIPGLTLLEPVQTRDRGMCCGAGGAQMFKEEEPGTERVNAARTRQLLDTRPDAVGSACPFCMRMLTDGLADRRRDDVEELDIAELLLESIEEEGAAPA